MKLSLVMVEKAENILVQSLMMEIICEQLNLGLSIYIFDVY